MRTFIKNFPKSVTMAKLSSILSLIYVNLSSLVSLVVSYYVKLKHKNLHIFLLFVYYSAYLFLDLLDTRERGAKIVGDSLRELIVTDTYQLFINFL